MKKLFIILSTLCFWVASNAQHKTLYPLPYDTVRVKKTNGTGYLDGAKGHFTDTVAITTMGNSDSSNRAASTAFVKRNSSSSTVKNFPTVSALRLSDFYLSSGNILATTYGCNYADDGGGGDWYWDATSTATDNTGLVVKPTGYSGTGRWRRVIYLNGQVNVKWFGAWGNNTDDDWAAFTAAYNAAVPGGQYPVDTTSNSQIIIPGGTYFLSDSFVVNKNVDLIGTGGGNDLYIKTQLKFPANKKGLVIRNGANTIRVQNLYIRGNYGGDTTATGIWTNTKLYVDNVTVTQFSGDGIAINTLISGNANTSRYRRINTTENQLNGIYVVGGESNAMSFNEITSNTNGRSAIYDNSFLGNNYKDVHTSFSGQLLNQQSWVTHGGGYYVSIWPYAQSGIEPQVTSGWQNYWQFYAGVDVPSVMFPWSGVTTYFPSLSFAAVGPSNGCLVEGLYTESGQGGVLLLGESMMISGAIGAGSATASTAWIIPDAVASIESRGTFTVRDQTDNTLYTQMSRGSGLVIGRTGMNDIAFQAYADTLVRLQSQNSSAYTSMFFALQGLTGNRFGRTGTLDNFPLPMFSNKGVAFADSTNTNFRVVSANIGRPVTGIFGVGDIILNISADTDTIYWKCTTAGTVGVDAVFTPVTGGGGGSSLFPTSGTGTATGSVSGDLAGQQFKIRSTGYSGGLFFINNSNHVFIGDNDFDVNSTYIEVNDPGNNIFVSIPTGTFTGGAADSSNYVGTSYVQRDWVLNHIANAATNLLPLNNVWAGTNEFDKNVTVGQSSYVAGMPQIVKINYDGSPAYGSKGLQLNDLYNGGTVTLQNISNSLYVTTGSTPAVIASGGFSNPNSGSSLSFAATSMYTTTDVFGVQTNGAPDASASLEVKSTTKGFLPPRMTGAQAEAISSPAAGLLVFANNGNGSTITSVGWWGYTGSAWVKLN